MVSSIIVTTFNFGLISTQQAIEHSPIQMNSAPDDQAGPSGAAEQNISEPDNMEVRGGRFSKSAEERQKMLKLRKEDLLQQARRWVHCLLEVSNLRGKGVSVWTNVSIFKGLLHLVSRVADGLGHFV